MTRSRKKNPKPKTSDAKRRRKMLWFLGIWAAIALVVATMRALSIRMDPAHRPLHPRQATPDPHPPSP